MVWAPGVGNSSKLSLSPGLNWQEEGQSLAPGETQYGEDCLTAMWPLPRK